MVHLGPKKPPQRKGSMAEVPRDLIDQIHQLEALFAVSPEKLKEISAHFSSELEKGLTVAGGNIPMNVGWVMDFPTGKEKGDYLAIDLGGTNLRVVLVKLGGNRDFDTTQSKYSLPSNIRTAPADELFGFIADCLKKFVEAQFPGGCTAPLPLGFTFSYPCTQYAINTGILQRWTKGFDIDGVEGQDVVPMLQKALSEKEVPINVVALINDTTGTLVASAYTDPEARMGLIFGTGCNGAYYEVVKDVHKLAGHVPADVPEDSLMAINCEYGAFDNEHLVLPRTKYDVQIDEESPRPGQQAFEKMISGYYLGEVLRLVLVDLVEDGFIFEDQPTEKLNQPFIMDTSTLSRIEEDPFENLSEVEALLKAELDIQTNEAERTLIRRAAELIGERAARLSVCGIAAICAKRGYKTAHCAADGSVFNKYPGFKPRAAKALRDIFDWDTEEDPIIIVPAEDGSGAGAAIIAALTEQRLAKGLSVGAKNPPK